jgi:hypothetical protein
LPSGKYLPVRSIPRWLRGAGRNDATPGTFAAGACLEAISTSIFHASIRALPSVCCDQFA